MLDATFWGDFQTLYQCLYSPHTSAGDGKHPLENGGASESGRKLHSNSVNFHHQLFGTRRISWHQAQIQHTVEVRIAFTIHLLFDHCEKK